MPLQRRGVRADVVARVHHQHHRRLTEGERPSHVELVDARATGARSPSSPPGARSPRAGRGARRGARRPGRTAGSRAGRSAREARAGIGRAGITRPSGRTTTVSASVVPCGPVVIAAVPRPWCSTWNNGSGPVRTERADTSRSRCSGTSTSASVLPCSGRDSRSRTAVLPGGAVRRRVCVRTPTVGCSGATRSTQTSPARAPPRRPERRERGATAEQGQVRPAQQHPEGDEDEPGGRRPHQRAGHRPRSTEGGERARRADRRRAVGRRRVGGRGLVARAPRPAKASAISPPAPSRARARG